MVTAQLHEQKLSKKTALGVLSSDCISSSAYGTEEMLIVLLAVYFFVRNAYVHHLVVRRVAPSTAGSAGWLLFVGLTFLSAAVVLAIINASKYLTFGVTAPLVAVGVVALIAALFTGRR